MKYHPHGAVLSVTFSVEEGLLLLSNPLCTLILQSALARAYYKHPVVVSHFIIQATHVHIVFTVVNPDDVPGFIRCFKTESAHMLNRVLGRKKRTIWCEGYDSPVVLDWQRAKNFITYLYANPAKDNLEDSIERFPGLSSWSMFQNRVTRVTWKRIHRPALRKLHAHEHTAAGYAREAKRLSDDAKSSHVFCVDPNAWMRAFNISQQEQEIINENIVQEVAYLEETARKLRSKRKAKHHRAGEATERASSPLLPSAENR